MRRLVHLKKDNEQQKTQLFFLAQRINQINQKMEEFKGIHYELKALVNLENSDDNTNFPDIGDSEPAKVLRACCLCVGWTATKWPT